jgi:hypothetical protein
MLAGERDLNEIHIMYARGSRTRWDSSALLRYALQSQGKLHPELQIRGGQAFDYFVTITGAKSEDFLYCFAR